MTATEGTLTTVNQLCHLVKMEIVATDPFPNARINYVFNPCLHLEHMKMESAYMKDEWLTDINRCQRLQHIDISFCSRLTDRTVKCIADGCAELQFLDIPFCTNMTDGIIKALGSLKHILELRVGHWLAYGRLRSIPPLIPSLCILRCD
jgi:hypothetical protein